MSIPRCSLDIWWHPCLRHYTQKKLYIETKKEVEINPEHPTNDQVSLYIRIYELPFFLRHKKCFKSHWAPSFGFRSFPMDKRNLRISATHLRYHNMHHPPPHFFIVIDDIFQPFWLRCTGPIILVGFVSDVLVSEECKK